MRALVDRHKRGNASLPRRAARISAVNASQNIEIWRASTSAEAAIPSCMTRPRSGSFPALSSETRTRPHAHVAMAAAVSGAVGFTAEPNESTIGVSATARPTSATRGEAMRESAPTANATNSAVMSTVMKRMR